MVLARADVEGGDRVVGDERHGVGIPQVVVVRVIRWKRFVHQFLKLIQKQFINTSKRTLVFAILEILSRFRAKIIRQKFESG